MKNSQLIEFVQKIVSESNMLKNRHTDQFAAQVNYACIFAQSESHYSNLSEAVRSLGPVVKETNSGLLYHVNIDTAAGLLRILKIRKPDESKPELGDADFTVVDYPNFKKRYLSQPGFKLISRSYMEMIELMESGCAVRTYFSDPPVDKQLLDED